MVDIQRNQIEPIIIYQKKKLEKKPNTLDNSEDGSTIIFHETTRTGFIRPPIRPDLTQGHFDMGDHKRIETYW